MTEQTQALDRSNLLFSRDALIRLIVPLIIEQLLLMTVGMADTVMVTTAGEATVSGVSLVDNINTLIIQIFSALSTGGARCSSTVSGPPGNPQRQDRCQTAPLCHDRHFGGADDPGPDLPSAYSLPYLRSGRARCHGQRHSSTSCSPLRPTPSWASIMPALLCSAPWATARFR